MATFTITPIKTFVSGETVTPAKLNELSQSTVALTAGTVTVADLATATVERLLPAGAVMPFAMNSAPAGWIAANGAAVDRVGTYAALFAAIGTTHGAGNGSTTFNLPDLRGYFIRGVGTNTDGVASGTFGTKQAAAFASHNHTGTTAVAGSHTHSLSLTAIVGNTPAFNGNAFCGSSAQNQQGNYAAFPTQNIGFAGDHAHTIVADGGTETRPANIALLYCIKF